LCSEGTAEPVADDTQRSVTAAAASHGYRATVLPVRSVGVQGDERTYAHPVLLDGRQDWAVLEKASTAITNSIKGVNRVLYGVRTGGAPYRLIRAHVTRERLDLLRAIDHQVTQLLHRHGQYDAIWQMPVVLLPLVNPAGGQCVVLRPITSTDAMTARFAPLNDEVIEGIRAAAGRIDGIGDIFMDITHKPPGTIEWE
jgi:GMP synthase (glutamine-hydrolysing)